MSVSALKVAEGGWENSALSAPVRGEVEAQLETLKFQLLQPIVSKVTNTTLLKEILWAANEAAALAWCTICPILILPILLEEKVHEALAKWQKQEQVRSDVWKRQQRLPLAATAA